MFRRPKQNPFWHEPGERLKVWTNCRPQARGNLRLRSTHLMDGTSSFDRLEAVVEAEESTAEYAKYAELKSVALLSELKLGFHVREVSEVSIYKQTRFVLFPRVTRVPRLKARHRGVYRKHQ